MRSILIIMAVVLCAGISTPQSCFAGNLNSNVNITQEEVKYTAIDNSQIPAKVAEAVKKTFADYNILKAFKGSDNNYKLVLRKNEGGIVVYCNADGKFYKKEALSANGEEGNE